jgi:hypothetical protein
VEQVDIAHDGTGGENTQWNRWREHVMEQVCNAETEKNVWGIVIAQPVVYFITITDFYQFRRINKCHNLINPCHICTYLQDPLLAQQFLLAATFSMIQNRRIEFCC